MAKVAVVTGASTGIGKEIARGLARDGHTVFMVSRDPGRAAAALSEVKATATGEVHSVVADLSLMGEARRVAFELKARTQRLDVLINNAAMVPKTRVVTSEGLESAFAANVMAPYVLTRELKGLLESSAPSRVVNFFGGNVRGFSFDDLQSERRRYVGWDAYGQSKVCVALLTIETARRLAGSGVTANCVWPGLVNTEGMRGLTGSIGVVTFFMRPLMRSAAQGAVAPIWVATAPELERSSGKFYGSAFGDGRKEMTPPPPARDLEAAKRMYEICERLAGG